MKSGEEGHSTTVALVELGGSHDECLLSQMHALVSAGHRVVLVCTKEIQKRNPIFDTYVDKVFVAEFKTSSWHDFLMIRKIWRFIKKSKATKVVLNTAQGSIARNLCWAGRLSSVEFTGIIHNIKKFDGSFTHKIISKKVKKFFLLSDFLLQKAMKKTSHKLNYFYPIRFAGMGEHQTPSIPTITIIGGLELRRKDFDGFIQILEKTKDQELQFVFLGKSNPTNETVIKFKKDLAEANMSNRVKLYEDFVDQETFSHTLNSTTLIIPLVHPGTPSANEYFKKQISGATNVAFGYKIPLLIHEGFQHVEEMKVAAFYYNLDNVAEVIKDAISNHASKRGAMKEHEPYNVEGQEQRFIDFLFKG